MWVEACSAVSVGRARERGVGWLGVDVASPVTSLPLREAVALHTSWTAVGKPKIYRPN